MLIDPAREAKPASQDIAVKIAKNRRGPLAVYRFAFHRELSTFRARHPSPKTPPRKRRPRRSRITNNRNGMSKPSS